MSHHFNIILSKTFKESQYIANEGQMGSQRLPASVAISNPVRVKVIYFYNKNLRRMKQMQRE